MIVKKLRLQRGWSQEQLAEMMGVSTRTIQRIERGHKPGLETSKSLAAVFGVNIDVFNPGDDVMNESQTLKTDELLAMQYVKGVIEFYGHLLMYAVFSSVFLLTGGWHLPGILWPFMGWGLGVLMHGLWSFDVFSSPTPTLWERRMVEKRLGRKL